MADYFRYPGEVTPAGAPQSPLSYRLPEEVYALDGDLSPEEARRIAILQSIDHLRRGGKTDAQVRAYLLQTSGLAPMHPCADLNGMNVCSAQEVDARIAEEIVLVRPRDPVSRSVPWGLIGAAALVSYFFFRRKK